MPHDTHVKAGAVSPERLVLSHLSNVSQVEHNYNVTDPSNIGSPTGARDTFAAMNRLVHTTPDPNMRNAELPKNLVEDLHGLGEERQEFTYMAKSGNRRVTFTTPKSASVVEDYEAQKV